MKKCFSEGKLISEQFFHDPPLCLNFKRKRGGDYDFSYECFKIANWSAYLHIEN